MTAERTWRRFAVGGAFACALGFTAAKGQVVGLAALGGELARPALACLNGFVWREAFVGDTACVMPERRGAVRAENAVAYQRVEPGGGPYGPDTCRQGWVWRAARPADHVCVDPPSRSKVQIENVVAPSRVARPACATRDECQARAVDNARRAAELRQLLGQRQSDLKAAQAAADRAQAQRRADDEAWSRAHPHLGRTSQPLSTDNLAPIQGDIDELQGLIDEQRQQQDAANATAKSLPLTSSASSAVGATPQ